MTASTTTQPSKTAPRKTPPGKTASSRAGWRERKRSAYPAELPTLVEQARVLADRLGRVPSQREVRSALRIGQPRAREVLAELARHRLHLVNQPDRTADPNRAPEPSPEPPTKPDAEPAPRPTPEPVAEVAAEPDPEPVVEPNPEPEASAEPAPEPVPTPAGQDTSDAQVPRRTEPAPEPISVLAPEVTAEPVAEPAAGPVSEPVSPSRRRVPVWPVLLLTLPALAAIWSGWVSLGAMAGFGVVHPLPGIADHVTFNTAITLPIGVETYAAYALYAWLSAGVPRRARRFAKRSAIASLTVGALGQAAYHLLTAAHVTVTPWPITTLVACLPVAVLGMGAALAHLIRTTDE